VFKLRLGIFRVALTLALFALGIPDSLVVFRPWFLGGAAASLVFSVAALCWPIASATIRRIGRRYTPLSDATLWAHDQLPNSLADIGRGTYAGNNPNLMLEWWGYVFAPKLVIFGKRAPSKIRAVYSDKRHRNDYDLSAEDGGIIAKERGGAGRWIDLEVRTSDLRRVVKNIRKEHGRKEDPFFLAR
jgi:hypothetical protein